MGGDSSSSGAITLEKITERLRREAPRAEGFGKSVKLDFGADGVVLVDARATPPQVSNEDAEADTVLRVSMDNFRRIVRGELDPMRAVLTRKLKIAGDMGAAMKLAQMFRDQA